MTFLLHILKAKRCVTSAWAKTPLHEPVCNPRTFQICLRILGSEVGRYYRSEGEEVVWNRTLSQTLTEPGVWSLSTIWVRWTRSFLPPRSTVWRLRWIFCWKWPTGRTSGLTLLSLRPGVINPIQLRWSPLFVVGTTCQLLVAKTASTIWANSLLRWHDAVLSKTQDNISFESFMELCDAPLSDLTELFPWDASEKAAQKSSCVLHDKAFQKAVFMVKGQRKPVKKLQFSQSVCGRQSAKCLDSQSFRTLSGKGFSSAGSKTSSAPSSSKCRKWKKFWRFLVSSATGRRHSRVALALWSSCRAKD